MRKILIIITCLLLSGCALKPEQEANENVVVQTVDTIQQDAINTSETGVSNNDIIPSTGETQNRDKDEIFVGDSPSQSKNGYQINTTYSGDTLVIKGDISGVTSGLIQKIGVTFWCIGNVTYGPESEYFLKKYRYPNFEYRINKSLNNICQANYEIKFYNSLGDVEESFLLLLQANTIDKLMGFDKITGWTAYKELERTPIIFFYPKEIDSTNSDGGGGPIYHVFYNGDDRDKYIIHITEVGNSLCKNGNLGCGGMEDDSDNRAGASDEKFINVYIKELKKDKEHRIEKGRYMKQFGTTAFSRSFEDNEGKKFLQYLINTKKGILEMSFDETLGKEKIESMLSMLAYK